MLDLDPDRFDEGDLLPRGWHFILLAADTRRSELRSDGFPGLGVPVPDLGLGRLVLGRRRVAINRDIRIGTSLQRVSSIKSLTRKQAATGPMAFATVRHDLFPDPGAAPAIVEDTTYVLLDENRPVERSHPSEGRPVLAGHRKTVSPDETLLFQYSALGFNSHRIHIDRRYARDVEGYPDLVVNGGLTTLLLTEFLRADLGLCPTVIEVKHTAPLFCARPITLTAERAGTRCRLMALDDSGRAAVEMEASVL